MKSQKMFVCGSHGKWQIVKPQTEIKTPTLEATLVLELPASAAPLLVLIC